MTKNFRIPLKYKKIHLKLNFSFKYLLKLQVYRIIFIILNVNKILRNELIKIYHIKYIYTFTCIKEKLQSFELYIQKTFQMKY